MALNCHNSKTFILYFTPDKGYRCSQLLCIPIRCGISPALQYIKNITSRDSVPSRKQVYHGIPYQMRKLNFRFLVQISTS